MTLQNSTCLVTGITDDASLAFHIAARLQQEGATVISTGLGHTPAHGEVSEKGLAFLEKTYQNFRLTAAKLNPGAQIYPMDVTVEESIDAVTSAIAARGVQIDGIVHSIAMDRTIRGGTVKPLMEVTRDEFLDTMTVSAYSIIALLRSLMRHNCIKEGASVVALSYLGAERVPEHPYRNIGAAKAALERIVIELAHELGKSRGIRCNVIRFSPYTASKAGGAIEGLDRAEARAGEASPLGNARPADLAEETAYLLRPGLRITGEIRHVDGGYHIRG